MSAKPRSRASANTVMSGHATVTIPRPIATRPRARYHIQSRRTGRAWIAAAVSNTPSSNNSMPNKTPSTSTGMPAQLHGVHDLHRPRDHEEDTEDDRQREHGAPRPDDREDAGEDGPDTEE